MSDDINQEILAELRKIRRMFFLVLVFAIICALPAIYAGFSRGFSEATPSWERVTTSVNRQDFTAALPMAQALVAHQPDYYYGHSYLGAIYLAMGDVTNAEAQYLRANELFPDEENEKNLAAVRKRLTEGRTPALLSK